ncbi:MAG TPA: hypothetical protein VF350_02420, partial [Candidatus Bathyarchaeia archaeon]
KKNLNENLDEYLVKPSRMNRTVAFLMLIFNTTEVTKCLKPVSALHMLPKADSNRIGEKK